MGRLISKKTVERKNEFDSRQRKSNLRNICGTFASEGMTISKQRFTRGYKRYKETSGLMEWKIGHIFHSIFT